MLRVRIVWTALIVLLLVGVPGCGSKEAPEPGVEPLLAPPVIGEAGVLRVGIDLRYPPFGGLDEGREAGLDVDVASAIAGELGLKLEIVEVDSAGAAAAFEAGTVDAVMSVPLDEQVVLDMSFAGFYATTGPALFASAEETVTPARLGTLRVAAQEGSAAYWELVYDYGEDRVTAFPTLREAFEAVSADEADVVAGDAFTCSYIARDFEGIVFHSQLAAPTQIGIAVPLDAKELSTALRGVLDGLATGGVLDTIRAKWVGDLPALEAPHEIDE